MTCELHECVKYTKLQYFLFYLKYNLVLICLINCLFHINISKNCWLPTCNQKLFCLIRLQNIANWQSVRVFFIATKRYHNWSFLLIHDKHLLRAATWHGHWSIFQLHNEWKQRCSCRTRNNMLWKPQINMYMKLEQKESSV